MTVHNRRVGRVFGDDLHENLSPCQFPAVVFLRRFGRIVKYYFGVKGQDWFSVHFDVFTRDGITDAIFGPMAVAVVMILSLFIRDDGQPR